MQDTTGHSFEAYFKRATSPLAVLRLLSERAMYGYEVSQELERRSGGKFTISLLYPVLYKLEERGFVRVERTEVIDGRARSYYAMTDEGRAYLKATMEEYNNITAVFAALMEVGNDEEQGGE